jgi:hypothetical protein
LNQAGVQRVSLANAPLAADLEGLDRLADGRLVFLSERLRSLVGENSLIAEYDSFFGEFANRSTTKARNVNVLSPGKLVNEWIPAALTHADFSAASKKCPHKAGLAPASSTKAEPDFFWRLQARNTVLFQSSN